MTAPDTPTPHEILRRVFGYAEFRDHQAAIIDHMIGGGDAFVLMPTGSGKSLCYQIPAMLRRGVGVVVSPLIALMQDQTEGLHQVGIRAEYLNSSLSPAAAAEVEQRVRTGRADLLYAAPERVMTPGFQRLLSDVPLALFAIDEAHCISQWGHDFRPEYMQLSRLSGIFPGVPRIALTATADPRTRQEIVDRLQLAGARQFISSFDRPNIRYLAEPRQNGFSQLQQFLKAGHADHSGLIYCLTRKQTEQIAGRLSRAGFNALPYHAGLEPWIRAEHQRRFLREEGIIIVATVAFGMGIDKPDVRFVVHMGMPQSLESYYQETGRAGRDGEPADAVLLYSLSDMMTLRAITAGSTAPDTVKQIRAQKAEAMLTYCETLTCRRRLLLEYFGEHREGACGNCDLCQRMVETYDGTVAAQKALSCVYRTGQRFGAEHLTNVLLGIDNDKIRRFGHDQVSTFGIGREISKKQWKAVYRQLVAGGLLLPHPDGKGGFQLAPESRPVLRGERKLYLRKETMPQTGAGSGRTDRTKAGPAEIDLTDPAVKELWETLRELRMETAREQDVPPYVVFHDSTLRNLVHALPETLEEMARLHGIGSRKLEQYGELFLAPIKAHIARHGKPERPADGPESAGSAPETAPPWAPSPRRQPGDTHMETLDLIREGLQPDAIAERRGLARTTIMGHIVKLVEWEMIPAADVISLPAADVARIRKIFQENAAAGNPFLKPVFETLEGKYDYETLRIIRTGMLIEGALKAPEG